MGDDETVTNEQLLKMVRALQENNDKLQAKVNDQTTRQEGQVDYYMCNLCGERLEPNTRCARHPNEQVTGVGTVFNPLANTVRVGAVSRS